MTYLAKHTYLTYGPHYKTHKAYLITNVQSKKISNDQELIQLDPTSCPQNQKGNN